MIGIELLLLLLKSFCRCTVQLVELRFDLLLRYGTLEAWQHKLRVGKWKMQASDWQKGV